MLEGDLKSASNFKNSFQLTIRTSQTKIVQSKGWLSDGCQETFAFPLVILGCWTMAFECHGQHLRPYEVIGSVSVRSFGTL